MTGFERRRPAPAGFDDFRRQRIAPELAALVARRRALLARMLQGGAIALLAAAGALWLFAADDPYWAIAPAAAAALAGLYAVKSYGELRQGFKSVLVARVAEFFGLRYTARPGGAPLAWFRELSLLPAFDRSSLEDRIAGTHRDVSVEFVEATLQERRTRQSRHGTRTHYVTVFSGLLCLFSFPKRFHGRTVVKTDRGGIVNWFQGLGTPGERVRLEDPRFEDAFEVWGSDQVEARYLLTPTFMERLLALDASFGGGAIRLAFDSERLLLAVSIRRDLFEGGSVFKPADDPARLAEIVDELSMLLGIVDDLQLQLKTRI